MVGVCNVLQTVGDPLSLSLALDIMEEVLHAGDARKNGRRMARDGALAALVSHPEPTQGDMRHYTLSASRMPSFPKQSLQAPVATCASLHVLHIAGPETRGHEQVHAAHEEDVGLRLADSEALCFIK